MSGEIARVVNDDLPALADDTLIAVARTAEARIDAVIKIKQLALKVTNPRDWTDQQGNPYLQVSGAEKIANLFNVSWSFLTPEPLCETEADGHYTYTFQGRFTMGGRSIEVEGSRSSKDSFFKQNLYKKEGGLDREKTVDERDNRRDVKMAALTNLLGNGITRLLGIRNLTWDDLEKFAGIKQGDVLGKVEYKKKGEVKPPQEKGAASSEPEKPEAELRSELEAMCKVIGEVSGLKPEEILYSLTVNKEGKFGESDFAAIKFSMPKKGGGEWSPLKAFHSKAKEQFDKATKESAA
jgi:hypothetical protein